MAGMSPAEKSAAISRLKRSFQNAQVYAKRYGVPKKYWWKGSYSNLHPSSVRSRLKHLKSQINNYKNRHQADVREQKARELQQKEAARQAKIKAQKAAAEQKARDEWNTKFDNAKNSALENANAFFANYDLNPADYAEAIDRAIRETAGGYDVGANFDNAFEGIGQRVFDNESTAYRDRALFDVNDYFKPNLGYNYIADEADDAAIAEILNNQYANAESAAQRARNRNQLTGTGYNAALEDLGKQRTQAESVLSGLGGSLLQSGRDNLEAIGNEARQGAQSLNLGQSFDISPYQDRVQNSLSDFLGSLKGNLSSQAGELFDTGAALSAGNIAQGAQNLGQTKAPKGIFTGNDDDDDPNLDRQAPVNSIF